MKIKTTMREALEDPNIFGTVLAGPSWAPHRVLLIAGMGEALTDDERVTFQELTGREREPLERVEELWEILGRRSGKSRSMAVLAAYLAALVDWSDILAPGERGVLPLASASLWQSKKLFEYLDGIFSTVPMLKQLVENQTADTISLRNRIDLVCRPASFRTIRGVTAIAFVCDELAFWQSDDTSRNPDREILAAARPALATTGGMLIVISSPYAARGELYSTFKRDYGAQGDAKVLVARAASRVMNPTLKQSVIDRAYERDPEAAKAEYGGEFRTDVAGWAERELIESAVDYGVHVRPPAKGVMYRAACDPSGGRGDSFTLAICHHEGETSVLDCVLEIKPPFDPASATARIAEKLKDYGLHSVVGDKYAAEWVVSAFAKCGIKYENSDRDRSAAYCDVLPLFTSGRVRLLDNTRLVNQFASLERRTSSGGKDRVDHGPGGHDDICNAAALALVIKRLTNLKISQEFLTRATQSAPPVFFHTSKRRV